MGRSSEDFMVEAGSEVGGEQAQEEEEKTRGKNIPREYVILTAMAMRWGASAVVLPALGNAMMAHDRTFAGGARARWPEAG